MSKRMTSRDQRAFELCKALWYYVNRPDNQGLYYCHYCDKPLTKEESTLDHILQYSRYPQYRYDISNLVVCCTDDNNKRGELDYDLFIRRFYPQKMNKRPFKP